MYLEIRGDKVRYIDILVDSSGSMVEYGKRYAVINILETILSFFEELNHPQLKYRFISWANQAIILEKISDIRFKGKSSCDGLNDYFLEKPAPQIIVISDGDFSLEISNLFKEKAKTSFIYPFALGNDANIVLLKRFAREKEVFLPENIISALHFISHQVIE